MSQRELLLLDVGNSRVKWCFIDAAGRLAGRGASEPKQLIKDLGLRPPIGAGNRQALVSSVAAALGNERLQTGLEDLGYSVWFAHAHAALGGLRNSYADPAKMGVDRWLAMLASRAATQQRLCVVDAGSALTIDMLAHTGEHEGGYILPGFALMQRSLFADTDRVRFDAAVEPDLTPGQSTAEAVAHGLLLAQCGAVLLAIAQAQREGPLAQVFLTGGGAELIAASIDTPAGVNLNVNPDLVFAGLLLQARLQGIVEMELADGVFNIDNLAARMR